MKQPYFPFYPGDWMKDPALRSVSLSARGLWTDMLCLMFESPRRGYLQHATGKPVTPEQLARMTGCQLKEVSRLLQELDDSGVFSRSEHGVIYSRRMIRDEHKRELCVEAGKKGGNPNLTRVSSESTLKGQSKGGVKGTSKGDSKGGVNPNPTLSFSSSVSLSEKAKDPPLELPPENLAKHKTATSWPDGFSLTPSLRQYALSKGVSDPEDAWEHFGNYHQAKGSRFMDWQRAWYTWCQNQKNFTRYGSRSGQKDISEMTDEEVVAFLNEPRERL